MSRQNANDYDPDTLSILSMHNVTTEMLKKKWATGDLVRDVI